MNKKYIFAAVTLFSAVFVKFYFWGELGAEQDSRILSETIEEDKFLTEKDILTEVPAADSTSEKLEFVEGTRLENDEFFDSFKFLTRSSFGSELEFNSAYITDDGSISRKALEDTFLATDFKVFIERMNLIEKSEEALIREALLLDKLNSLPNIQIYSEDYSCAGKVCTLAIDFNATNESVIEDLSNFAINYTFTNIIESENGIKKFKGIYIETDDPSRLTLQQ